jgi:rod shape-determining protein MreD
MVLFGAGLLAATAVAVRIVPLSPFVPDPAALLVLHLAITRRGSARADGAAALALGYLFDLASGGPRGLHALGAVVLFLGSRSLAAGLLSVGPIAEALFGAMAAGTIGTVAIGVQAIAGRPVGGLRALVLAAAQAAASGLAAPLVLGAARWLDARIVAEASPSDGRLR